MANIKKIKSLRGGVLQAAAQTNVQIDAEIGQKTISGWKRSCLLRVRAAKLQEEGD
ncbi:hypothetical protein [Desulfatiglans anilini]|uniref:hypothetical protein n=1 Tax=Desulfatiglans anilini TaxID=90728 RepID=UPI00129482FC|nr:hypothetical protein [Desulfatiglans anilini]